MQLTYDIELSSFVGTARGDLPPPSQVNRVGSTVTIPDGYTIVVGGLSVRNLRESVDSIPILGQIPILKYAFSRTSKTNQDTTLFVFIRPVILREDKFQDLKYISATKRDKAGLQDDCPVSYPIAIHERGRRTWRRPSASEFKPSWARPSCSPARGWSPLPGSQRSSTYRQMR